MISSEYKASVNKIDLLDLTMVRAKLCLSARKGGKGWTVKQAETCEIWYKRFLKLKLISGKKILVPTEEIDTMWHYHILDTFKYHEDCNNIFGRYLHHFPYFGLRGQEDAKQKEIAFSNTMDLFQEIFKQSPLSPKLSSGSISCGGMDCG